MVAEESFAKALYFGDVAEHLVFPWPEPDANEADTVHAGSRAAGTSSRSMVTTRP